MAPESFSRCEPWRQSILAKLEAGLTAQRIYQDIAVEEGYEGSYYSVSRFVRKLGAAVPLPFRRMECEAGAEAQVDFGTGARIVGADGRSRRSHVLRVVLSCRRKGYSEAVDRQSGDNFLRALENAFAHFGGVPRALVIDNLRAAVKRADWFDPELSPKVTSFAAHYGVAIVPTRPYTPRHKGKIERGIRLRKRQRAEGPHVQFSCGAEPLPGGMGVIGGRCADPRDDAPAGGQALRGGGALRPASAAAVPVRIV